MTGVSSWDYVEALREQSYAQARNVKRRLLGLCGATSEKSSDEIMVAFERAGLDYSKFPDIERSGLDISDNRRLVFQKGRENIDSSGYYYTVQVVKK
ncbi:MAG: hypothetical protein ACP5NS_00695 [Candidatus Pacearchaeota archaeon]